MLTFTGRRNLYGDLTNDDSTANLALGDTLLTDAERAIIGMRAWPFLEKLYTQDTVIDQQFYEIPNEVEAVLSVYVVKDSFTYTPIRAPSVDFWNQLNVSISVSSDIPAWWYLRSLQVGLYPIPSSAVTNGLNIVGRKRSVDLTQADYTTGTITTATNGSTAIVGTSTVWTAGMTGSFIRITSTAAASGGDGQWYEIASIDSNTTLTLTKPYQGTSIAAGSAAYALGQASALPEDYDILPVYRAVEIYFTSIQPEAQRADLYKRLYDERLDNMVGAHGRKSDNVEISSDDPVIIDPNLFISF